VLILNLVALDELDHQVELITLVNLDGHERLDLGSDEFGKTFLETHQGEVLHDLIVVLLLLFEIRDLVDFLALAESVGETGGPQELNTEQGDLRLVSVNELSKRH